MTNLRFSLLAQLLAAATMIFASFSADAVYPETGMYVDTNIDARGRGYYVEVQNDLVFLVVYAYDEETGEAEIYSANSEIRADGFDMGFLLPNHPPFATEGYFPLHWMVTRLYKVTGGPCLGCYNAPDGYETEDVGAVAVWFPHTGMIRVAYVSDDGEVNLESFAFKQNYRLGQINTMQGSFRIHEVMGQWVFIDQSNLQRPPWRFDFDERIPAAEGPQNAINVEYPFEVTFRDSIRGAEFRCELRTPSASSRLSGCELHFEEEVLFSANYQDIGATRIRAFLGELPPMIQDSGPARPEFFRGTDAVIGLRVETPPDLDGEP